MRVLALITPSLLDEETWEEDGVFAVTMATLAKRTEPGLCYLCMQHKDVVSTYLQTFSEQSGHLSVLSVYVCACGNCNVDFYAQNSFLSIQGFETTSQHMHC